MVFDLAQELIDEDYHRSDVISARYGDLPKPLHYKEYQT